MSILALLPDILPMILPSPVQVTKASDLEAQRAGSRDSAMIRQGAVIGKSDKMCATGEHCCPPFSHFDILRLPLSGHIAMR